MHYDNEKLEQALLAMLYIHHFDDGRVWKGYPFELMDILHSKGYIDNPANKNKSVYLTPEGLEEGRKLAEKWLLE